MVAARSARACRRRLRPVSCLLCGVAAVVICRQAAVFVPAPSKLSVGQEQAQESVDFPSLVTAAALLTPTAAVAKGGVYGPLEGKTSSLVHPLLMGTFFLVTLYTGFMGWQWRQVRLVGVEITDLRKTLPKDEPEEGAADPFKATKDKIAELTSSRKELIQQNFKDRHYQISSGLLAGGIFFTVYGVFNTWFRTERLFPGPHLFAGAAICVGWALAAACVPYMEKGNEAARNAHIALNVVIFLLFCWQLPTGFEILQKVWGAPIPWF